MATDEYRKKKFDIDRKMQTLQNTLINFRWETLPRINLEATLSNVDSQWSNLKTAIDDFRATILKR